MFFFKFHFPFIFSFYICFYNYLLLTFKTRIMKKTLLVSTALFLASVSFAQTKVNNSEALKNKTGIQQSNAGTQVNNSENASSATTIHTGIVENAKESSSAKIKEQNQAVKTEKQAVAAKAKMKAEQTESRASNDKTVAVSTRSNAKVHANSQGNNMNGNASINGNENISTGQMNKKAEKVNTVAAESVHATVSGANRSLVAVKKSAYKTNAASTAKVNTTAASVQKAHVKPVRVKTNAQVRTVAGLKIK